MQPIIRLLNFTKMYGSIVGVDDISLDVMPGYIFGFLGPNGSGKTTTISTMVDLIRPTKGSIEIFGLDSVENSLEIRSRIGYLAGDFALERGLTGWQQLEFFGNLRGDFNKNKVGELAERLNCDLNRKFKTLSRGNKQKVGLISALMHDPELLILDEPTSGLDPLIQSEFNKIIMEYKKEGKTVFISSHVLSEIQELCNRVVFVREGKLIADKTMKELSVGLPKEITVLSKDKKVPQMLEKLPGFVVSGKKGSQISGTFVGDINLLLSSLAKHKIDNLHLQEADLETVFMQYYEDKNV